MRYFVTYTYFAYGRQHQSSTFVDLDTPIVGGVTLTAAVHAVRAQGQPGENSTESRCDRIVYFREIADEQAAVVELFGCGVTLTHSAGADGAVLVMIDTEFEPDASDSGPGLRVLVNDEPVYAGKDYEPADEANRP